jgi:hypothetical protein
MSPVSRGFRGRHGTPTFVEIVANALVSLGYPPDRVKTERFGGTGGS